MLPSSLLLIDKTQKKRFIKFSDVSTSYNGPVYFFLNNRDKIKYDKIRKYSDTIYEFVLNDVLINGVYKFNNVENLNKAFDE